MRTACPIVIALAIAHLFAAPAGAQESVIKEYGFSPGKTLELDLADGGSVEILGSDRENIEVAYGDARSGLADHGIQIEESAKGLRITSSVGGDSHSHSLSFTIRGPRRIHVVFKSMGGDLILKDVEGEFTGETMGGSLALTGVTGAVDLKTFGGDIEAADCALHGKLVTMGGEIVLKDVTGGVEAESFGGNVRYEGASGPREERPGHVHSGGGATAKAEDPVRLTSMGGDINVDEAPAGADVRTAGGDIHIRQASRFVKAKTGGGNIEIEAADGPVDASTGGGDIRIRATNGSVSASTGAGDIEATVLGFGDGADGVTLLSGSGDMTLRIPADASVTFDLEIAYTKNSSQNYTIESDFTIIRKMLEPWDKKEGSPKKRILGTGESGGGKHVIRVKTVNGNIRIEKTS